VKDVEKNVLKDISAL